MIPTEEEWPLEKRIRGCFEVLEALSKYRDDALFQPSPVHVVVSVSAAREALDILLKRLESK